MSFKLKLLLAPQWVRKSGEERVYANGFRVP
jgi:hypothetical protein